MQCEIRVAGARQLAGPSRHLDTCLPSSPAEVWELQQCNKFVQCIVRLAGLSDKHETAAASRMGLQVP